MRTRLGFLFLALASTVQGQEKISSTPLPAASTTVTSALQPAPESRMSERAWIDTDYFVGFVRRPSVPPLILTIPAATANQSTTNGPILFPRDGRRIDYNAFNGLRARVGSWFDDSQTQGLEFSGFVLEQRGQDATFFNSAPAANFLTRNFIDSNSNRNIFLFGDNTNGPVVIRGLAGIKPIYSTEVNYLTQGYSFLADRTDYLFGFRYYDQRENLRVDVRQDFNGGGLLTFTDRFATSNQFYGANFGIRSHFYPTNRIGAEATFKLAAGDSYQRAKIDGSTLINIPGVPFVNTADGLYARPSNIGSHDRHFFTVIPEVNLRLNYALSSRAKIFIGYDCVYVSSLVRPGQVIDPVVFSGNLQVLAPDGRVDGPNRNKPFFSFRSTDQVINAVSIGLSLSF